MRSLLAIVGLMMIIALVGVIAFPYSGDVVGNLIASTCADSDGRDPHKIGQTFDLQEIRFDTCADSSTLVEFTCEGSHVKNENLLCPFGCSLGACNELPSR